MANGKIRLIGTVASRLVDLPIQNNQLIFIKDKHKIALDTDGKRTFYNDITVLNTDEERQSLLAPINGCFYFVIDTAVLWFYQDDWKPLSGSPEEIVFIGVQLPELGSANKLYVNKSQRNISVWDKDIQKYISVGEVTGSISDSEIDQFF